MDGFIAVISAVPDFSYAPTAHRVSVHMNEVVFTQIWYIRADLKKKLSDLLKLQAKIPFLGKT